MKVLVVLALICSVTLIQGKAIRERREEGDCPEKDCKKGPLDISFVVDASASIKDSDFTKGLWFVQNFVDKFTIGPDAVRVSMVTYGDRVYEEDAFNFADHTNKEQLNNVIVNMEHHHGTATETGAGIEYMLDHQLPHARKGVKKVIIVLTDGNSHHREATRRAAERAAEEELEVFAIGVGSDVSEEELHTIASDDDHVFTVSSYHLLESITDSLRLETCGGLPEPERTCHAEPTDINFIIDSSQSIGKDNFTDGLEFIQDFLSPYEISREGVRVAAVMFGHGVYEDSAINFDAFTTKKQTLDAIASLEWEHGTRTDTGLGIDYMVDHFLPNTRAHAAHIGIVITDGKSQQTWKTEEAAVRARKAGVIMYAVGVGSTDKGGNLDMNELTNIAGDRSRVLISEDYARLNLIKSRLIQITCAGIAQSLEAKKHVHV